MTHFATDTPARRSWTFLAAAAVVLVGVGAYANSLATPFVFDDTQYVARNPAIRRLWPPYDWLAFCPTRPLPYLTFALNYAVGGYDVRGYHVVNIAIHLATALTLFGLIRRTLRRPVVADRFRRRADGLAAAIALLWVAHPLTTQAVTYVYQRIESLAALFAAASLYAFVRAYADGGGRRRWIAVSMISCYAAMLSKESVAALPIVILLYDRLFFGDNWRDVLRRRYYHAVMFCSWGIAGGLMAATGSDYGKAGIGSIEGVSPLDYLLSQSGVILHYLRLSFVPTGLCLDYALQIPERWEEIVPQGIAVVGLLVVTIFGLIRGRLWSFPACTFFLLLAPTSSVVPIADLIFEHRMYLPLAAVLALAVFGGFELLCRLTDRRTTRASASGDVRSMTPYRIGGPTVAVVVAVLAVMTHYRNRDYVSELNLWHDTVAKAPRNPRPYCLIGRYHHERRRRDEARRWYEQSVALNPGFVPALHRLAVLETEERRFDEADFYIRVIAEVAPKAPMADSRLGFLYLAQGQAEQAAAAFGRALSTNPQYVEALDGMALLLASAGRLDEAAELRERIAEAEPDDPSSFNNLGTVYRAQGRNVEAIAVFRQAVALDPYHVESRSNLGAMLDRQGLGGEGLAELARAIDIDGDYIGARINLGTALARRGRFEEAIVQYREALRIDPTSPQAAAYLKQAIADQAAADQAIADQAAAPSPRS